MSCEGSYKIITFVIAGTRGGNIIIKEFWSTVIKLMDPLYIFLPPVTGSRVLLSPAFAKRVGEVHLLYLVQNVNQLSYPWNGFSLIMMIGHNIQL